MLNLGILHEVAREVAQGIKHLIERRRAEERKPQEPVSTAPYTQAERVRHMDAAAAARGSTDWRRSFVDLQKTLDLPSSYSYRRWLAVMLDVVDRPADYIGSADQNERMHKIVWDEVLKGDLDIPETPK